MLKGAVFGLLVLANGANGKEQAVANAVSAPEQAANSVPAEQPASTAAPKAASKTVVDTAGESDSDGETRECGGMLNVKQWFWSYDCYCTDQSGENVLAGGVCKLEGGYFSNGPGCMNPKTKEYCKGGHRLGKPPKKEPQVTGGAGGQPGEPVQEPPKGPDAPDTKGPKKDDKNAETGCWTWSSPLALVGYVLLTVGIVGGVYFLFRPTDSIDDDETEDDAEES